ncbi:MAG: iron ABC transporter permease [Alphaproteobacteria bacterium]|nr:iron ABC transporter permease [Alphaproteobacteria bacterium]
MTAVAFAGGRPGRGFFAPAWRSRWFLGALAAASLTLAPLAAVLWLALFPSENIWPHLAATVLPRYLSTTALLLLGVGAGTVLLGTASAWLVTMCDFPLRRHFAWALLLPLAVPGYISAYVYTDLLDYSGPLQRALRAAFGWSAPHDYWFPEIRGLPGAIFVLSCALYPYVYMLARATFLEQSVCVLEASRVLGRTAWQSFFSVALPLARPALIAGTALALMEALNDFGTVDYFAVQTLTRGVFDVWLHMGNLGGAAQIAAVMLAAVIGLLSIERAARRQQLFHHTTQRYRPLPGQKLSGWRKGAALMVCALPVVLGFGLPFLILARYALGQFLAGAPDAFFVAGVNSLLLAAITAGAAVALALFLAYSLRLHNDGALRTLVNLAGVGYALPGAVLAIGVLAPLSAIDHALDSMLHSIFGLGSGLLLSGGLAALVFAYLVRFLAVSLAAVTSGMGKISPSLDQAARSLGRSPGRTLTGVHLPLLRASLFAAATLVFVDCMKELPATLLLRPFNFETLATHVYQFAHDERLAVASPAALGIVLFGLLPVVLLGRGIARPRAG